MKKELSINDVVAITTLTGDSFCTSQSPDNIALLAKIAKMIPPGGRYLEIGTRTGMSTVAVAMANLDLEVYAVERDLRCNKQLTWKIKRIYKTVSNHPLSGNWKLRERIHFVGGWSKDVARKWRKQIDFLFLDGDHTKEGIETDIGLWLKYVKVNGFVGFHDYADEGAKMDGSLARVTSVVNKKMMSDPNKWFLQEANYHLAVFRKLRK